MNFLKMAQEVRHKSGVQGTGPSSIDTTGYDQVFVTTVKDVWKDIQVAKKTWKWMRASEDLLTQVDKTVYTIDEIFGPVNRFKAFYPETFYIESAGKKTPMVYMNYENFIRKFINEESGSTPRYFSIRPQDSAIVITKPNAIYGIYYDYHKSVQELTLATDIPECPSDYHNIIVYGSVASYAISMGMQTLQQEYSQRFTEGYDQMVREQVPKAIFKVSGIA